MSEQIKRVEINIMRALELIKKDNVADKCKNADFIMEYLEKTGQKNEDFLFIRDEIQKPVGDHTSFIAKTYAQFSVFFGYVLLKAAEVKNMAEKFAVEMTQDMITEKSNILETTVPQLMSRFGYSREKALSAAEEALKSPQVQAQLNSNFESKVKMLDQLDKELSACIKVNRSTHSFSCESELVCRQNACDWIIKNGENKYFEFERMSSSQLSKTDMDFLEKLYELSQDLNIELFKIRRFLPKIVEKELEEKKKELAEYKRKLETERKRFKLETEGKAAAAKKEIAEIDARIAKGFFPKIPIIITVVAFLITLLFYYVIRWEGTSWTVCFAVPGFTWIIGMYLLFDRFKNGSSEEKEFLDKKKVLESVANPNEDEFGEINDTKMMIELLEDESKSLEEELKSVK